MARNGLTAGKGIVGFARDIVFHSGWSSWGFSKDVWAMRKWVSILLVILAVCLAAEVTVSYVHAAGCDQGNCCRDGGD